MTATGTSNGATVPEPLRDILAQRNGVAPGWLHALRESAGRTFLDRGFPTRRQEEWKYTDLSALSRMELTPPKGQVPIDAARRALSRLGRETTLRWVLVNGRPCRELSSTAVLPDGLELRPLSEALEDRRALLEPLLGRIAPLELGLASLNTALLEEGLLLHVSPGMTINTPIQIVCLTLTQEQALLVQPRVLVVAEENSAVSVVEWHLGAGRAPYLSNVVTEVAVGPGAAVTHYKIQDEARSAFHVGVVQARQQRDARFRSCSLSFGARLARNDINTDLCEEGAECRLDGLYMAGGEQHVDHHTSIDHRAPHCRSEELYKGILDGRARGVFNGKVYVRPHAQKSDAQQINRNLLLSERAEVDTKPQLEIFADDVKCAHGATIGRLDNDALFYLRSRGLDEDTARGILVDAFAREVTDRIADTNVRAQAEQLLDERFDGRLPEERVQ